MNDQYREFQVRFNQMSDEELVQAFNDEVEKKTWTGARANYLVALWHEFLNRNIDVSEVSDSLSFSLKNKVHLVDKKLMK